MCRVPVATEKSNFCCNRVGNVDSSIGEMDAPQLEEIIFWRLFTLASFHFTSKKLTGERTGAGPDKMLGSSCSKTSNYIT